MSIIYRIYFITLITPIILILVIATFNNKDSTRIRLLIWQTPAMSIGKYIALSTITGYTMSSIVISNIKKRYKANNINSQVDQTLENQIYNNQTNLDEIDTGQNKFKEPTLIEREPTEAPPTVSVPFRIISKEKIDDRNLNTYNKIHKDNLYREDFDQQYEEEYEGEYDELDNDTRIDEPNNIQNHQTSTNDWNKSISEDW